MLDNLFLLATGAFGWGLSLATYRWLAQRLGWPLGALQADLPIIPVALGVFAVLAALAYSIWRGVETGGWVIVVFGLVLAFVWTAFLRVGSQISLFLAPIAGTLLLLGWLSAPLGWKDRPWARESIGETLSRKREQIEEGLRERILERDKAEPTAPSGKN